MKRKFNADRRTLLKGLAGLGAAASLPPFLRDTGVALAAERRAGGLVGGRILVVLELNGGNDGLNTVVPYRNDVYYENRPTIAMRPDQVLRLDDDYAFHPSLVGWERLYKDGKVAVVHGCGYPNPNRSHFVSMAYWHSGRPNEPEAHGWVGRFADAAEPGPVNDPMLVNIAEQQSPAVRSATHSAVVFSNPAKFRRDADKEQEEMFARLAGNDTDTDNPSLRFLHRSTATAGASSDFIRSATRAYRTRINYGFGDIGPKLRNIAALVEADFPARIYYVTFGGFDTHNEQRGRHQGLMIRIGDAMLGFMQDLERIGRADDVAVMAFSEFGRRVKENANTGTDHGVAGPMFVFGNRVKGGLHGVHPSLTDLDSGDLRHTTDFRQVYATMIEKWMGGADSVRPLKGSYETLDLVA